MTSLDPIPPDDVMRRLTLANPNDPGLTHLVVGSNTYTILVHGDDTAGRYALIDMLVPASGGPPPHRHDFEEMFHVLDGEIEVVIRGETSKASAGETVNIPALAPHSFRNPSDRPARLLCLVAPAGLEAYFAEFADRVPSRTSPPPQLSQDEISTRIELSIALAPKYRIQVLAAPGTAA